MKTEFDNTVKKAHRSEENQKTGFKDPVCGMDVHPEKTKYHFIYEQQEYHFCSEKCRHKFEKSPEDYLRPTEPVSIIEGAIYTCPMHPEVEQIGPGECPICGMALELKDALSSEEDTTELDDMTLRFWVSAILSFPTLLWVMLDHIPGKPMETYLSSATALWIQFALASPVILWAAIPFFKRGWASMVSRNLNMFTLIALGTGVAYLYSVVGAIVPEYIPCGNANGKRSCRSLF